MVTVSEVVHGLELFVDDTDAGLMGADGDILDVFGGLAHAGQLLVDVGGSLNGGLRVEFSCNYMAR